MSSVYLVYHHRQTHRLTPFWTLVFGSSRLADLPSIQKGLKCWKSVFLCYSHSELRRFYRPSSEELLNSSNYICARLTVFCDIECMHTGWRCFGHVLASCICCWGETSRASVSGLTSCGFQAEPVSVSAQLCPIYCLSMLTHIHPITRSHICIDNSLEYEMPSTVRRHILYQQGIICRV